VRRVIEPILTGEILGPEVLDAYVQIAKDLGLVASGPQGLAIANPRYRDERSGRVHLLRLVGA
jgi:hypothetical protein